MKVNIGPFKNDRKIKVTIDKYDTWNADHTLALVILPVLHQFRKGLMGSPNTADEDVPELLRSSSAPSVENEWDSDDNHLARWEWLLDQMIWSFQQVVMEEEDEPSYNDANKEAYQAYHDRVNFGFLMFGKYYRSLWN